MGFTKILKNMLTKPWHPGQPNGKFDFLPTDTQQIFDELCKNPEYRNYFQAQGWLEPGAITYELNSDGFRCSNFNKPNKYLIALGCSFTVGIGLPLKDTWPQMAATALELNAATLAWGGSSADTCFRLAEYWVPKLQPKLVVMLTPPVARFELISKDQINTFLPSHEVGATEPVIGEYIKRWFAFDENSRINRHKNQLAIKALCAENNVPCLIYNAEDYMARSREDVGYARDRMHAGPTAHKNLTETIIHDWNEINT